MSTNVEVVDGVLKLTRTFRAPRDLVFAAWTEPERVQAWWGCAQTTSVEASIDLQVGGEYRHVMQIEGAGEVTYVGIFTVVDPPQKLAWSTKGETMGDMVVPDTTTTVDFTARGDETEVCVTVDGLGETPLKDIVSGGWQASLAKLDAALA